VGALAAIRTSYPAPAIRRNKRESVKRQRRAQLLEQFVEIHDRVALFSPRQMAMGFLATLLRDIAGAEDGCDLDETLAGEVHEGLPCCVINKYARRLDL
jgi:hypothetical protein